MNCYDYMVLVFYVLNTVIMFIYGFHYYIIAILYFKKKKLKTKIQDLKIKGEFPFVTVQLPIFNELYVAERLVRQVICIDYPKDKFEIQVLDDSIDETQEILKNLVKEYRALGFDINYIHRIERTDQKAGALKHGLEKAKGEFIAIFDSDFMPPEDFLLKTLPHFTNNRIGMIQTRWGHLNQEYSLLTKAQSMGIDGHFVLEQTTRSDYNLWLNFNGTAGVWRKECILDAGNWSGDTLTEDLDLSYRAQLKGWEFRFLQDVVSPAELPVEMTGYKSQQFRWAKGSIQTAIKLMWKIIRSPYPWKKKLEGMIHLTYYSVHPLMLFNLLWTLPLLFVQDKLIKMNYDFTFSGYPVATIIGMIFMILGTAAPSVFFVYSQKEITGSWVKRLKWLPYLFLVGLGIAVHITKAFVEAIFRKKSTFIRTPKFNVNEKKEKWLEKKYGTPINFITILEILAAAYALIVIYFAFAFGVYLTALFPILFTVSFSYVAFSSIYQQFKRSKFKELIVES
ncbi:MAG: glycosyltransferase family 2 protein [Spirochaetota bacterium]|nr:glycosyltransferase family 2 protein [Spirochaetota bacterium]